MYDKDTVTKHVHKIHQSTVDILSSFFRKRMLDNIDDDRGISNLELR